MMMEESMRNFIVLAEHYIASSVDDEVETPEEIVVMEEAPDAAILHDLDVLATRLRTFMESEGGDFALGVETGMQRAADMIENLIRRYNAGDQVE
jgi:hypothetical protein